MTQKHRNRQTQRQADRQTYTDRQTDRQTESVSDLIKSHVLELFYKLVKFRFTQWT